MERASRVWLGTGSGTGTMRTALGCRLEGVWRKQSRRHSSGRKALPVVIPDTVGTLLGKERNAHCEETQDPRVPSDRGLEGLSST